MATEPPTAQQTAGAGGEARGFREAVRALGAELEGAALEAEAERALPRRIVGLLREAGLFWLKTARELGGSELDPLDFCDVLEEVAYLDASAAWAVMVGNGATGVVSGLLDDDGAAEVFGSPAGLPILAGQFIPRGEAARVAGGYRISGRWSFCSGISHADWAVGGVPSPEDGQPLIFCVPVAEVEVHDVWHAAGLQGTASNDFSLADRFVPASRVVVGGARRRGGRLFRQPHRVFVGNEVPPVAVGVARRALDDMAATAAATARAWSAAPSLAERASFQEAVGRVDAVWASARALYREAVEEAWTLADAAGVDAAAEAVFMSRTTLAVELCIRCVAELFPYAGGRALALTNPLQRHYRNLLAAGQHVSISDENFERTGAMLLGRRAAERPLSRPPPAP